MAAKFTTEQETNEDRQTFLVKKIKQTKQRTDAQLLPQLYVEKTDSAAQAEGKHFKFQASVLTHIAEFKKYGQEYIENQFIDRQFREQTDYHFEKYQHIKIKQQARDAAKLKYIKPQDTQTGLLHTQMFKKEAAETASASYYDGSQETSQFNSQRQPRKKT